MPGDYQSKIVSFDNTGSHTSQQHVDRMNDVFDLQEVDEVDVKMRLCAQRLGRDVKKWFMSLPTGSIANLDAFHQTLLARWEIKKNPLQLLNEYKILKRKPNEGVEEYCQWFNIVYNAIPQDIKPSPSLSLIYFPDGFDVDMEYQLRERDLTTLEEMKANVIKVEANILAKKAKLKYECRVTIKQEPSTYVLDHKIDNLVRVVNQMMQRVNINEQTQLRENQNAPRNRNQNFGRNVPQIKQREQKGSDQQVRPPFQENYKDDEGNIVKNLDDNKINLMGINNDETIFLTQEEQ